MYGSMTDIQPATAEIRRGKKEERKKERNHRMKILWSALFHRATIRRKKKPQGNNIMPHQLRRAAITNDRMKI